MDRWQTVRAEIADFRRYLSDSFPPIDIRPAYDFDWGDGSQYKASRKDGRYSCCGVYLFYDEAGTLLYVGKAMWTFDKRIWSHAIAGESTSTSSPSTTATRLLHWLWSIFSSVDLSRRGTPNALDTMFRDNKIPSQPKRWSNSRWCRHEHAGHMSHRPRRDVRHRRRTLAQGLQR